MAVCQGKTLGELITTYQTLIDLGYKHIAFNHSSIAYQELGYENPLKSQMYGRMEFIRMLVANNTIRDTYYHHLLGASDWREFQAYKDWSFIKSVDTSSPIINGAENIRFSYDMAYNKPKHKLEHYFEKDLSNNIDIIKYNIELFKKSIS
jgi:hypothetical protein